MLIPANAYRPPAVVLLAGAGPNDRDESVGAVRPFRDLARGLAQQGVASLRYDKRTWGRAAVGPGFTTKDEYVIDALDAFRRLRASGRVDPDRIFLLGHSFGGSVALRVAEAEPGFAGVVLMAAPTRSLPVVLLRQFEHLTQLGGALGTAARAQIPLAEGLLRQADSPRLRPSDPIASPVAHDAIAPGLTGAYFLDLREYDPLRLATTFTRPALVLHAGRDFLVNGDDLARWRAAFGPNASYRSFPQANHLLINGIGPATPTEYEQPGHVSAAVISDLAEWIRGN